MDNDNLKHEIQCIGWNFKNYYIYRSAKAGYFASMYKRFGNLCYVLGALRGFWGHTNRDLRIKVSLYVGFASKRVALYSFFCPCNFGPLQFDR